MSQAAKLALEDGSVFAGTAFGAIGEVDGEVVFNTSMTGYQEILTDPSYRGQIVTMTYPEIGNVGTNDEDVESGMPHLAGFIIRDASRIASNFRSSERLDEYLLRHNIVGLEGIDTRALVRRIRTHGALKGVLSSLELNDGKLIERAQASPGLVGRDLVREVLPVGECDWQEPLSKWWREHPNSAEFADYDDRPHVVALDFGMKRNIGRHLVDQGFRVTILPGTSDVDTILGHDPDALFLSNGPGDPEPVTYGIESIRALLGRLPIFGICLGHQLFALACDARTFKLPFGHRGANQPIKNLATGRIEITTQNHGFAVEQSSLPQWLEVTHVNLNDDTIAGLKHREHAAFSVQYHPEASAGPHDSQYLFDDFRQMVVAHRCSDPIRPAFGEP